MDTQKQGNLDWYFQDLHQHFLATKEAVKGLINLKNKTLYRTATDLENRANRAIMPGIVAITAALLFTFIFTYLINFYIVNPIITITDRANKFKQKRIPYQIAIETKDEISDLSEAISHLCTSIEPGDH